jgi:hypothetical protein
MSHPIGFSFESVILHDGNTCCEGIGDAACPLLHDVLEFVAEKKLSMEGVRIVLTRSEMNLGTPGKSQSPNRSCVRANVNANVGEAGAKSALHFGLDITRKGPSTGSRLDIDLE